MKFNRLSQLLGRAEPPSQAPGVTPKGESKGEDKGPEIDAKPVPQPPEAVAGSSPPAAPEPQTPAGRVGTRGDATPEDMDVMETPPPFGLDAALRERLGERLGQFLRDCDGAYGVALSTLDGNPLVHRLDRDTLHGGKLAAMTSSLLGVGESIAREVEQRDCQFVILENSDGRLVSLRVDKYTMLTCITDAESPLGTVLNSGRSLAGTLARLLREPPPASPEA